MCIHVFVLFTSVILFLFLLFFSVKYEHYLFSVLFFYGFFFSLRENCMRLLLKSPGTYKFHFCAVKFPKSN